MNHVLKAWEGFYRALESGKKTHELRFDDRNFQVGDTLEIHNWSNESHCFTAPYTPLNFEVTHILKGERWGIKDGFADLSIKRLN